jgi:hypothetical protein
VYGRRQDSLATGPVSLFLLFHWPSGTPELEAFVEGNHRLAGSSGQWSSLFWQGLFSWARTCPLMHSWNSQSALHWAACAPYGWPFNRPGFLCISACSQPGHCHHPHVTTHANAGASSPSAGGWPPSSMLATHLGTASHQPSSSLEHHPSDLRIWLPGGSTSGRCPLLVFLWHCSKPYVCFRLQDYFMAFSN